MTPAGTSKELDVQNEWEEKTLRGYVQFNKYTHTHTDHVVCKLLQVSGASPKKGSEISVFFVWKRVTEKSQHLRSTAVDQISIFNGKRCFEQK